MEKTSGTTRIFEFDIIRVLAMFWVVTYHFGCEYSLPLVAGGRAPLLIFFCDTPNFDFGNVAVTMFLVLSGALLYNKYGKGNVKSIPSFYVKRFKAIYPPFWILNLYVPLSMFRHWMADGNLFFAGNPLKLLLTVVGLDGYLQLFGMKSYYFCGDWFVGAIVFLYLVFPLLSWAYSKSRVALLTVLGVGYMLQFLSPDSWQWEISAFPVTLVLKFVLGFLVMDFLPGLRRRSVGWVALAVFAVLCVWNNFPLPILRNDMLGTVAGIAVFLGVLNFGSRIRESSVVGKVILKIAPMAYCVFLIQHVAIVWMQMGFVKVFGISAESFSPAIGLVLLAVTFGAILLAACLLKFVSDRVVKLAERKFLS
ncbi:MAG: acyltransferase [Fibrobacter sp.]|nr:acyltransferase [Fibrobacter sp.]